MIYLFNKNEFSIKEPLFDIDLVEKFPKVEEESFFYPEGNLQSQSFYQNARLHGPSRHFSTTGQLLAETWFWNGERQGIALFFYESGAPYAKNLFCNGKKLGEQQYFYEDGLLKTKENYNKRGLHGEIHLYWPNGQLKRWAHFSDGKRGDFDRMWNEEGIELSYAPWNPKIDTP